jgi:hypothetical protein
MARLSADQMIGMKQRFLHEPAHVGVLGGVEHAVAFTADPDQPSHAQLRQVLGHR